MRQFHTENEQDEARLNVLYARLRWMATFGEPCAKWGIVWSGLYGFAGLIAATDQAMAYTGVAMAFLLYAALVVLRAHRAQIEREWDSKCPCPVCVAKRAQE